MTETQYQDVSFSYTHKIKLFPTPANTACTQQFFQLCFHTHDPYMYTVPGKEDLGHKHLIAVFFYDMIYM